MKNIKLYIDDKLADVLNDQINIVLNKSIIDFSDISKRTGSYSFDLSLPTSQTNCNIFKFINIIDAVDKFKQSVDFKCSLYVDDNLLIDGLFILNRINKNNFIGNITNRDSELFSLIGEKFLQDLNLPEIPFEGVYINFSTIGTSEFNYTVGSDYNLNKNLGFDLQSLLNGYKDSTCGLIGSTIDYRDYYDTYLINYGNQFIPLSETNNSFSSNLSIDNVMPRIKLNIILKQIFKDVGYDLIINTELLNNDNISIPFVGEQPLWNWKHLSKSFINTDPTRYGNVQDSFFAGEIANYFGNTQFERHKPIIVSQNLYDQINNYYYNASTGIQKKMFDKIFSNYIIPQTTDNVECVFERNGDENFTKLHYTPTNNLISDPNNNFNISGITPAPNARDSGWLYTAPCDGVYEFDVTNYHDIRMFQYWFAPAGVPGLFIPMDYDTDKIYMSTFNGYEDGWEYTSKEKYYWQNFIMFAKVGDEDTFYGYENTFNSNLTIPQMSGSTAQNYVFAQSAKLLSNFNNDNVLAFYSPMIRDLHIGQVGQTIEDYFVNNQSILVNPNTIPQDIFQRPEFMGFSPDTEILKFSNDLVTPYSGFSDVEQKRRKMVKLGKSNYQGKAFGAVQNPRMANGEVNFKFTTTLKRGEQVRMYYLTYNMLKKYATETNKIPFIDNFQSYNPYSDLFTDDMEVRKFNVKCISEEYTDNLKLSNFLPENIKQTDFLQDYIKTNNIFFNVNSNDKSITFQKRGDFFKEKNFIDITSITDLTNFESSPLTLYEKTNIGIKQDQNDDLNNLNNPIKSFEYVNNINVKHETLDNTSQILFQASKKNFNYLQYNFEYDNRWKIKTSDTITKVISILNLTENGEIFVKNSEGGETFSRSPRIVIADPENRIQLTGNNKITLINSSPFKQNGKLNVGDAQPYYDNQTLFNNNFNDSFIDLSGANYLEVYMYIDSIFFANVDLSKAVRLNNSLYYIQDIEEYNVLNNTITKVKLLRV